jgi:hypothetical protein
MRLRTWINGRAAVYLYVVLLWLLIAGLAWGWADAKVTRVYEAVAHAHLAVDTAADTAGPFADSSASAPPLPQDLVEDARDFGTLDDASAMRAGWFADYRQLLARSLLFVVPIAVLLPMLIYMLAALAEEGANRLAPWRGIPERFVDIFDQMPYILWSLLGISVAGWFFSSQPLGRMPEWFYHAGYRLITLTGFGLFLFVFLFREQRDRLRTLRRSGIIDAERVTGISPPRIYQRLFWYRFKPLYLRQVLYLALFIMLLEFSFNIIYPFHKPGGGETVFYRGGDLFRKAGTANETARISHGQAGTPLEALRRRLEQLAAADAEVRSLLRQPEESIASRRWLAQVAQTAVPGSGDEAPGAWPRLKEIDRLAAYWSAQRDAYIALNALVLFSMFMLVFVLFDLPVLVEERET